MSSIAGLWRLDGRPDVDEGCARMLAAQSIYARDGHAQWSEEAIALGRGLSLLLPEDGFDCGPQIGVDGRYVLAADLRLDNRDELSVALNLPPERARTLCDAAILLAAFERWDNDCHDRLAGDYAFALWDAKLRRLVLARSPMGQRPLHYHRAAGLIAFASMPKGLHALPEVPCAPDEEKFAEFLALLPDAGTRSFYAGIERVLPGHVVTVTAQGVTSHRHWQPARRILALRTADDYGEAMRHHLDQAVRCRLRGVTDVGAHLSSGFDSSAVAATAARLLRQEGRGLIAFTAVPRQDYRGPVPARRIDDEAPLASLTAAMHPNIEHVLVRGGARSPLDELDWTSRLYDQPTFGLMSWGMANNINDAARERQLKVVLGGGLGNATISYDGLELLPELLGSGHWLRLWTEMAALVAQRRMTWRSVIGRTFGPWVPEGLWTRLRKIAGRPPIAPDSYSALNPLRSAALDIVARARARGLDPAARQWSDSFALRLWMIRRNDNGNQFKGILGGWGIDQRNPLADRRLVEFCLSVPTAQFLYRGETKALARRALADRVPAAVLDETRRGYQAADWHERASAARARLAEEFERLAACPAVARSLDIARMRSLIDNWPAEGFERNDINTAYRQVLLGGISAAHFLRRASGQARTVDRSGTVSA